jgi:oligopeptide/dipeptide ABC transporter ATP-binding protein
VGILGESGSGKSTLARALVGLVEVEKGEVFLDRFRFHPQRERKRRKYRRWIQMIFQDPYGSLNPLQTVGKILKEVLHKRGEKEKGEEDEIAEILHKVGLSPEDRGKYPYQLSGGQRQRVGIARALLMDPAFLIADEPTSNLDVSTKRQILHLLTSLQKEKGFGLLFITHDVKILRWVVQSIMVMYAGQIVEWQKVPAIFSHPFHPYTKALLDSVPDIRKKEPPALLGGEPPSLAFLPSGCPFHPRCPRKIPICESVPPPFSSLSPSDPFGFRCHNPL